MELRITAGHSEQVSTINRLQESQDTHRYDETLNCHEATRDKLNFMYLIIQRKNISCKSFFKKERKYFDDEKRRIYSTHFINVQNFGKENFDGH